MDATFLVGAGVDFCQKKVLCSKYNFCIWGYINFVTFQILYSPIYVSIWIGLLWAKGKHLYTLAYKEVLVDSCRSGEPTQESQILKVWIMLEEIYHPVSGEKGYFLSVQDAKIIKSVLADFQNTKMASVEYEMVGEVND